jgi:2-polyprenyl-3-methyl-5-hydroxy-6-metoxy-1,4-benzoquinol methylase
METTIHTMMHSTDMRTTSHMNSAACPLCSTRAGYFCEKNGHTLYKCPSCKLLFVYPIPPSASVYDETYFSGADNGFGYVDYDVDKEPMIPVFEKYMDTVAKLGLKSGKLLDVGAATGFFMDIAKKRGFAVKGVELSDYAAAIGRKKGLDILTQDLEGARLPAESFDIITLFDVLEHVPDPKKFLLEVKRLLKKGGLIVVNTPNGDSIPARILGTRWHLIVPPEHLHYFSPKNLGTFMKKNGFSIPVNTSIGKRFTLKYIFKTLYRWQKLRIWAAIERFFHQGARSRWYIPLNTHDNLFMIFRKD